MSYHAITVVKALLYLFIPRDRSEISQLNRVMPRPGLTEGMGAMDDEVGFVILADS